MISTQHLSELPSIETLRKLTQSLAVLDAIIEPEWERRYYSFDCRWGEHEQLASMRNGEGDFWILVFTAVGALLKGFDHESRMSSSNSELPGVWPGLAENIPPEFTRLLREPAFSPAETTFLIWRTYSDKHWCTGSQVFPPGRDPDGSERMLSMLDGNPRTYRKWAEEYFRRSIDIIAVEKVFSHVPLTEQIVAALNATRNAAEVFEEMKQICYPE